MEQRTTEVLRAWEKFESELASSAHLESNASLELIALFSPPDFPYIMDHHTITEKHKYRCSYKDLLYSMRDFAI